MAFFARKREPAAARIAPCQHVGADPLAVALPALGALGTIASLASLAWSADAPAGSATRSGRRAALVLRDLESDCLAILEALRKLNRALRDSGGAKTLAATPFKFGLLGSPAARETQSLYRSLLSDLSHIGVSAHANVLEVVHAVQQGMIDAPDEAFYGFGECQERLNQLLSERRGLSAVIDGGVAVAIALTRHVTALKAHART